jgi:hypothetical protein
MTMVQILSPKKEAPKKDVQAPAARGGREGAAAEKKPRDRAAAQAAAPVKEKE